MCSSSNYFEEYLEVTAGSDYDDPGSDECSLICMDDPAASGAAYVSSWLLDEIQGSGLKVLQWCINH